MNNRVRNVILSKFRSEGISGALFRICPLETFDVFLLDNFWIGKFTSAVTAIEQSGLLHFFDDMSEEPVGVSGFVVRDFTLFANRTAVTQDAGSLGGITIAPVYITNGGVTIV